MTDARTAADLTMELAGSGTKMPLLGLGTWQLRGSACRRAVGWALEVGYRHIDTAAMYGNESEVVRRSRPVGSIVLQSLSRRRCRRSVPAGVSCGRCRTACGHSGRTTSTCGLFIGRRAVVRG
jgi:hypothetical protein